MSYANHGRSRIRYGTLMLIGSITLLNQDFCRVLVGWSTTKGLLQPTKFHAMSTPRSTPQWLAADQKCGDLELVGIWMFLKVEIEWRWLNFWNALMKIQTSIWSHMLSKRLSWCDEHVCDFRIAQSLACFVCYTKKWKKHVSLSAHPPLGHPNVPRLHPTWSELA